jgi:hypothetical protein
MEGTWSTAGFHLMKWTETSGYPVTRLKFKLGTSCKLQVSYIYLILSLNSVVGGSVIFLLLLIIIIAIAPFGSHNEVAPSPVVDEHFKIAYTACGPVEG